MKMNEEEENGGENEEEEEESQLRVRHLKWVTALALHALGELVVATTARRRPAGGGRCNKASSVRVTWEKSRVHQCRFNYVRNEVMMWLAPVHHVVHDMASTHRYTA